MKSEAERQVNDRHDLHRLHLLYKAQCSIQMELLEHIPQYIYALLTDLRSVTDEAYSSQITGLKQNGGRIHLRPTGYK